MPRIFQVKEKYGIQDLLEIMRILRSPEGCPWDREQTHQSIRTDFLEETHEALEAINNGDAEALKEELGDVLLQVVFHARIEEEQDVFAFDDVVDGICKKLVVRHPHVFGQETADSTGPGAAQLGRHQEADQGRQNPGRPAAERAAHPAGPNARRQGAEPGPPCGVRLAGCVRRAGSAGQRDGRTQGSHCRR